MRIECCCARGPRQSSARARRGARRASRVSMRRFSKPGSFRLRRKPSPRACAGSQSRPATKRFDHAATVHRRGWGDCDDLAPYHAASLRHTGEDPGATAVVYRSGPNRLARSHATERRHDRRSLPSGRAWARASVARRRRLLRRPRRGAAARCSELPTERRERWRVHRPPSNRDAPRPRWLPGALSRSRGCGESILRRPADAERLRDDCAPHTAPLASTALTSLPRRRRRGSRKSWASRATNTWRGSRQSATASTAPTSTSSPRCTARKRPPRPGRNRRLVFQWARSHAEEGSEGPSVRSRAGALRRLFPASGPIASTALDMAREDASARPPCAPSERRRARTRRGGARARRARTPGLRRRRPCRRARPLACRTRCSSEAPAGGLHVFHQHIFH